jgi:hypothetical protein
VTLAFVLDRTIDATPQPEEARKQTIDALPMNKGENDRGLRTSDTKTRSLNRTPVAAILTQPTPT